MTNCYFAQLFLLDEEQLHKMLEEQLKEKDNQLEIDFEKANAEAKQDEMLSKMNKKELIEYIKEQRLEIEKCNESRRCEIMLKNNAYKENENIVNEANKKIEEIKSNINRLLFEKSKAESYIKYLEAKINTYEKYEYMISKAIDFIKNEFGVEINIKPQIV